MSTGSVGTESWGGKKVTTEPAPKRGLTHGYDTVSLYVSVGEPLHSFCVGRFLLSLEQSTPSFSTLKTLPVSCPFGSLLPCGPSVPRTLVGPRLSRTDHCLGVLSNKYFRVTGVSPPLVFSLLNPGSGENWKTIWGNSYPFAFTKETLQRCSFLCRGEGRDGVDYRSGVVASCPLEVLGWTVPPRPGVPPIHRAGIDVTATVVGPK